MQIINNTLKWSPRVSKDKIRRLYDAESKGIYDEALIEDVGLTLYLRCRDILYIDRNIYNREMECPSCLIEGRKTFIPNDQDIKKDLVCPECGWSMNLYDFRRSFRRKQLSAGGAGPAFRKYMDDYRGARTPREKMLAIDLLIHEFHYSIKELPDQVCRPACVNIINGNLTQVLEFLDTLSGLAPSDPAMRERKKKWESEIEDYRNIDWKAVLEEKKRVKQSRGQTSP